MSRGSLGHYSRHVATGAHFGSAFVHSHTRRTNSGPSTRSPKTCSRSVDDSECGFIECATRQLFLRGLSHAEVELGLGRLMCLDFALFHYQGIFLVQGSGRSHLCLYRQLILLCAKIFLAGPTSAEVRESRNRKTFDEITHDEKSNKYYGM